MRSKRQRGEKPSTRRKWLAQESYGKSTPRTVRRQEERLGKILGARGGGRRRPGSGSNPLAPGDAVGWKDLGEAKQTAGETISISRKWLAKLEDEAAGEGKVPVFHLMFLNTSTHPNKSLRHMTGGWGMVPDWFLARLLATYEEHHAGDGDLEGSE